MDVPIPILPGDGIEMLGAGNGTLLDWIANEDGSISITVPAAISDAGKYCWAMKVVYLA